MRATSKKQKSKEIKVYDEFLYVVVLVVFGLFASVGRGYDCVNEIVYPEALGHSLTAPAAGVDTRISLLLFCYCC